MVVVKEQWGYVVLTSTWLCANLSEYQCREKLLGQHPCQAWCLCHSTELEASECACVHEQASKQWHVMRNPKGFLGASKGERLRCGPLSRLA